MIAPISITSYDRNLRLPRSPPYLALLRCSERSNASDVHDVEHIVEAGPTGISAIWLALRACQLPVHAYRFVKAVLRLLCRIDYVDGPSPI
jgi:hypothetical protein